MRALKSDARLVGLSSSTLLSDKGSLGGGEASYFQRRTSLAAARSNVSLPSLTQGPNTVAQSAVRARLYSRNIQESRNATMLIHLSMSSWRETCTPGLEQD